ncbi:hypothetical protein [Paenibacillus sp. MBLB4367]|uniref:hypothetical protein n=1 Tax=Paenibacillus sp. MBLB4367 TaxID=3384767 RepID=UPI0039082E90
MSREMVSILRYMLELLRILVLVMVLGILFSVLQNAAYSIAGFPIDRNEYAWLARVAILVLIYVLYRNRLQFSGWYKGAGMQKLSKPVTFSLLCISLLLMVITPLLD